MMRTIYKYEIKGGCSIFLPRDARCVLLSDKDGSICAWFMHDKDYPKIERRFVVLGTGFPVNDNLEWLASMVSRDGYHVWHLFEEKI